MPTVGEVGSLKITIFFNDTDRHATPHLHIRAPEGRASVAIEDFAVLAGNLNRRRMKAVLEWARQNKATLVTEWNRCNP